jgi:hypothetical protein
MAPHYDEQPDGDPKLLAAEEEVELRVLSGTKEARSREGRRRRRRRRRPQRRRTRPPKVGEPRWRLSSRSTTGGGSIGAGGSAPSIAAPQFPLLCELTTSPGRRRRRRRHR